mmetsp:Transcript_168663/g.536332  ORF Transcript_168663/g.536332 Transcript_168663/m.536332 type:complete len:147 (+) Transcript_168663:3972-4412(+)
MRVAGAMDIILFSAAVIACVQGLDGCGVPRSPPSHKYSCCCSIELRFLCRFHVFMGAVLCTCGRCSSDRLQKAATSLQIWRLDGAAQHHHGRFISERPQRGRCVHNVIACSALVTAFQGLHVQLLVGRLMGIYLLKSIKYNICRNT